MAKLKLLPYYHENYDSIAKEAVKTGNFIWGSWWYLHGKLEDILGYDKASVINAKECPEYIRMIHGIDSLSGNKAIIPELYINDIIECEVVGVEEPCIGYFWTTNEWATTISSESGECFDNPHWDQRGLVCLKSDVEGCEYALKKYKEKSRSL